MMTMTKNVSFNLDPFQKDDFFDRIDMDPARNPAGTDDLSIKFFEGGAFPLYSDASEQSALAEDAMFYPRRAPTRSFSLIMDAYEQDQRQHQHQPPQQPQQPQHQPYCGGASGYPVINANFMPAKHMEILCNSDAPPPSIRELYGKYGPSQSSNTWYKCAEDCGMDCCEKPRRAKAARPAETKIPRIPQKQIAELLSAIRKEGNQAAKAAQKKRKASPAKAKPRKPAKRTKEEEPKPPATTADVVMSSAYERSLSIGTRVLQALDRTNKKASSPAAARKAARQEKRALKAKRAEDDDLTRDAATTLSARSFSEVELLFQQTKAVINQNEHLKSKLEMMNKISSAQILQAEESEKREAKD